MQNKAKRKDLIKQVFPFLNWLKTYDVTALRSDLFAGVTVAVVLIPQPMAYGSLRLM